MLKNKTKIIAVFLVLILLFSATSVFADDVDNINYDDEVMPISIDDSSDEIETSVEDIISDSQDKEDSYKEGDVYLIDDNITIDYIIDGNLFVCANTVTINSQIGGDAFILAKNLIIDEEGYIFSNLFTIADTVEIKGVVYDAFALSKDFTVSNGYIYRDLKVSCNTLNVNGAVGRNAYVNCSTINFNSDEGSNGIIYGDLNYTATSEIEASADIVNGSINYTEPNTDSSEKSIRSIIADYILDLGAFVAFVLIVWLLCLVLAPKFLANTNTFVGKKTLSIFGYGLLTLIAIPIACIILILLQLTSGFSLFLLVLYILAIVISKSLFTITANNYICSKLNVNKNVGIFGMLVASGIVVWAITQIPYIGGLVSFIISVLGLGILVYSILPKRTKKHENNSKTEEL